MFFKKKYILEYPKITMTRYKSLKAYIKEIDKDGFMEWSGLLDRENHTQSFKRENYNIKEYEKYSKKVGIAMCCKHDEQEILFWIDTKKASYENVLGCFAHETGHLMPGRKKNQIKEEMRANTYGSAAVTAYQMANKIFNEKPKKNT